MKIFQRVQNQYAIVGICSSHQSTKNLPFSERDVFGFLFFGYVILSDVLLILYMANGFMEYMVCICSISAAIIVFVCYAAIVFRQTTLFKCIENIEKLIDTRSKYPKSKRFFSKTNRQVEQLSEIVFTGLLKIALQCFMVPNCIVSFCVYFLTDSGSDAFQLPFPMWFPFNPNNPINYLVAVMIEYFILAYEFLINASTLGLGIGAFWFAISATKEIRRVLHSINDKAQAKANQSNELKVLFTEFIYAHSVVKQVEHDFSDILQPIFISLFTWSLLAISGAMLIIQMEILHHGGVILVLLNATLNGILGLILVFIACELGQRMSVAFEKIELTIDQFDWYLFPIEIKRMLPMIIVNAQQPVILECFGSIICTREVFKKIINRAYSYFMVLNQLGGN